MLKILSELRKESKSCLSSYAYDFVTYCEDNFDSLTNSHEYIFDLVSQCADSNVSIYYCDLKKWAMENIDSLEDVIEEGFYDPSEDYDFYKHIQMAQFWKIEQALNEELGAVIRSLALYRLLCVAEKDYSKEELEDLEDYLDPYAMSTFDEIAEAVDNFVAGV